MRISLQKVLILVLFALLCSFAVAFPIGPANKDTDSYNMLGVVPPPFGIFGAVPAFLGMAESGPPNAPLYGNSAMPWGMNQLFGGNWINNGFRAMGNWMNTGFAPGIGAGMPGYRGSPGFPSWGPGFGGGSPGYYSGSGSPGLMDGSADFGGSLPMSRAPGMYDSFRTMTNGPMGNWMNTGFAPGIGAGMPGYGGSPGYPGWGPVFGGGSPGYYGDGSSPGLVDGSSGSSGPVQMSRVPGIDSRNSPQPAGGAPKNSGPAPGASIRGPGLATPSPLAQGAANGILTE